jgi:hypothetical protein
MLRAFDWLQEAEDNSMAGTTEALWLMNFVGFEFAQRALSRVRRVPPRSHGALNSVPVLLRPILRV